MLFVNMVADDNKKKSIITYLLVRKNKLIGHFIPILFLKYLFLSEKLVLY